MNQRQVGESYENAAASYLQKNGVRIIARNFRCRQGEIDLIGWHGGYLVFFEVKYRRDDRNGNPAEAVDWKKQRKICRTAAYFLYQRKLGEGIPVRFDVVGICGERVDWYQNAFDFQM